MIAVLDASAALEVVLQRKRAAHFRKHLAEASWVIAPDLFVSEVTNAFWKYYQFTDLPKDTCEAGIDAALSLPDDLIATVELARETFALACLTGRSAYDTFYLTLARRHDALLLTLDEELKAIAAKHAVSAA